MLRPKDRYSFSRSPSFKRMPKETKQLLSKLPKNNVKDMAKVFELLDKDKRKKLTRDELKQGFRFMGYDLVDADLDAIMDRHDVNRSGTLDFAEFCSFFITIQNRPRDTMIDEVFNDLDLNKDGQIDKVELAKGMQRMGFSMSDDEIMLMIKVADKNGDEKISRDELRVLIDYLFEQSKPATPVP